MQISDENQNRYVPKPGDVLEWQCTNFPNVKARWRVVGCFWGATGQESLIEMECLTHTAGWTGEWEWHPRVFVPEQLTRTLALVPKEAGNG